MQTHTHRVARQAMQPLLCREELDALLSDTPNKHFVERGAVAQAPSMVDDPVQIERDLPVA
mgnify:FL=1